MTKSKTEALRREYAKASAPDPTATPAVTRVSSQPGDAGHPVSTAVPNPSSEALGAAWPAAGPVMRWDDGVGQPGLDVGGYPVSGHSDRLQPANDWVVASMAMDPNAQEITGGGHARGTDFNSKPISPLFDRGAPVDLRSRRGGGG